MNQVFHNVIINATQAMPDGGIIQVRGDNLPVGANHPLSLRPGRYVKISLSDHGGGIPTEHLQKIFDPYFTTRERGSGLGLATAYAIVTKHQGYMTAESDVGVGTTLFVYLPASHKAPLAHKAGEAPSLVGKGKILVMDDEAAIRELVGEMLTSIGYEVDNACDGAEAIALYQSAKASDQPYAAVILDVTIPGGIGGKETITTLREIDPHVKAIVSSGYSNDPVMADFRQYGFSGVVAKPYTLKVLNDVLQQVIVERNA